MKLFKCFWVVFVLTTLFNGCISDSCEDLGENYICDLKKFIVVDKSAFDILDTAQTSEYTFNEQGQVINEKIKDYTFINNNMESEFTYNDKGQILNEIRNGKLYFSVEWKDNIAIVTDSQGDTISINTFENGQLKSFTDYANFGVTTSFFIDTNQSTGDIIIRDDNYTGTSKELLNFDTKIIYPFYYINSITILRKHLYPFIKHTYSNLKQNPYYKEDFGVLLTFYKQSYTYDECKNVIQIKAENLSQIRDFIYIH